MATDMKKLNVDLENVRSDLNRIRGEIRVRLHLGAMEARERFATLESEIDRLNASATRESLRLLKAAHVRLQELSFAFGKEPPRPAP